MRKTPEIQRFPQSAVLFRFCLRVLETRSVGGKIHDQEVGNILQYNPSDTSHWKRGKKSVRSVYALEALANKLDVDHEVIQDLADGVTEFEEAWFDFLEAEEEKRLLSELTPELHEERRLRQRRLQEVAGEILSKANVKSVPVYLPEILAVLPFIQVTQGEISDKLVRTSRVKPGLYTIRCRKNELRAHTRAALAREIARVILFSEREQFNIPARLDPLSFFEMVDFSNALLVPKDSLRMEISKSSAKVNMARALADVFWVPKSVIRARLSDVLLEGASNTVFQAPLLPRPLFGLALSRLDLSEDDLSQPPIRARRIVSQAPMPNK